MLTSALRSPSQVRCQGSNLLKVAAVESRPFTTPADSLLIMFGLPTYELDSQSSGFGYTYLIVGDRVRLLTVQSEPSNCISPHGFLACA